MTGTRPPHFVHADRIEVFDMAGELVVEVLRPQFSGEASTTASVDVPLVDAGKFLQASRRSAELGAQPEELTV